MSDVERNKALARQFFAAMARCDAAAIVDSLDDEGRLQTMGSTLISGIVDKDTLRKFSAEILGSFPQGLEVTIHNVTAEDDRVAVEAEARGPHVSGKIYHNRYHFLFRYRNGKILEMREYLDTEQVTDVLCGGKRPAAAVASAHGQRS
jgi:ketosteroid isomerase-like protein